ncbi:hypothetical protein [Spiroplasma poulsonii]|uniref:hypothetical protein n=1 Tax=Spiroplasma poulsonii TaxID=2138 RepID=UPI001319F14B|nr:hypothetical protein [Spiroplasma poulsonii]
MYLRNCGIKIPLTYLDCITFNFIVNRLLALLVKKLQIFVKKILIEKYNFN